jgi:hypothetical protein
VPRTAPFEIADIFLPDLLRAEVAAVASPATLGALLYRTLCECVDANIRYVVS